jgi:hypothetical protein
MSSLPAAASITALHVSKSPAEPSVLLVLNVTNFQLPRDGFVIVYMIKPPAAISGAADGDEGLDPLSRTFIDAVTYPGKLC